MRACLVKMRLTLQCCTNVTFPMDFKEKFCFTPFRKCRLKKEVTHYCPLTLLSPALALTQKEANELETIAIKPRLKLSSVAKTLYDTASAHLQMHGHHHSQITVVSSDVI